jgi:RNA polymerase sigma-70 factor (ECF subfamily)
MGGAIVSDSGSRTEPVADNFEAFFLSEYPRLKRALFVITTNDGEAEELAQEAFVRMWERWTRVSRMERPLAISIESP